MARPVRYREAILALLKENPIHPSVDWIHGRLRQAHPRVSLATVYRTLRALVAEGLLCELPFGTSEARFGLSRNETHYHFICQVCRRIYDLPLPVDSRLEQAAAQATGHEVTRHTAEFYGRCRECAGKEGARGKPRRSPPDGTVRRQGSSTTSNRKEKEP